MAYVPMWFYTLVFDINVIVSVFPLDRLVVCNIKTFAMRSQSASANACMKPNFKILSKKIIKVVYERESYCDNILGCQGHSAS